MAPPPHSLLLAADRLPRLSQGCGAEPITPSPGAGGLYVPSPPARPGSTQPQAHPGGEVCSSQACARLRSRPSGERKSHAASPDSCMRASVGLGRGPQASCFLEESLGWPVVRLLPKP